MSWMGKWNGYAAGNWYGAAVAAVIRRVKLLRAKFVLIHSNEIFVRKAPNDRAV